jgi:hypothetical protein
VGRAAEYLWTGDVVNEKKSEWEGRRDGVQASERQVCLNQWSSLI